MFSLLTFSIYLLLFLFSLCCLDGKPVNRCFHRNDDVQMLYIFLRSLGHDIKTHKLQQRFPHKDLSHLSGKTLEEVGLFPNPSVLFLAKNWKSWINKKKQKSKTQRRIFFFCCQLKLQPHKYTEHRINQSSQEKKKKKKGGNHTT